MAQGCKQSILAGQQLSTEVLYQYAKNAGFTGQALDTIVAIAQRESGGYTQAICVNYDGSVDSGVLQFNSNQPPVSITQAEAFDPQTAFDKAFLAVQSRGFQPWAVYNTGMIQNVSPPPIGPSNNNGQGPNIPPANPNGPLAGLTLDPSQWGPAIGNGIAAGFANVILGFKDSFINGLETFGIGALGLALILGGIVVLAGSSNIAKAAEAA